MSASISVVIPTYNSARYLPDAVASVQRQGYAAEIIVVDDGSTDDTVRVASALGRQIRFIQSEHSGIAAARNRGVEQASGAFLAFLDADDVFMPDKLASQLAHLRASDGPDLSFGRVEEFVSPDLGEDVRRRLGARPGALAGYVAGAMLVERDTFRRIGPFNTQWRVGEFVDWYARATDAGLRSQMLEGVVLRRRLHDTNIGLRERHARVDFARILKHALDRRRQVVDGPST